MSKKTVFEGTQFYLQSLLPRKPYQKDSKGL